MKQIYLIRHGIAQHNILFKKIGEKAFYDKKYYDTKLVEKGTEQSINLGQRWKELANMDVILTSSLSRALETSQNICMGLNIPIVALDELKEYPQGLQTINKRSIKNDLIERYPGINFENIINQEDTMWKENRIESIDELDERIKYIKEIILHKKEQNIAIVSHSLFINRFMEQKMGFIEKGEGELLHCYPYKYIIKDN